jgi:hypothetical protein
MIPSSVYTVGRNRTSDYPVDIYGARIRWGAAMAHDGLFELMLDLYMLEFKFSPRALQSRSLLIELEAGNRKTNKV